MWTKRSYILQMSEVHSKPIDPIIAYIVTNVTRLIIIYLIIQMMECLMTTDHEHGMVFRSIENLLLLTVDNSRDCCTFSNLLESYHLNMICCSYLFVNFHFSRTFLKWISQNKTKTFRFATMYLQCQTVKLIWLGALHVFQQFHSTMGKIFGIRKEETQMAKGHRSMSMWIWSWTLLINISPYLLFCTAIAFLRELI